MVLVREMISNVGINEVRDLPESIEKKRWPWPHFFRRVVVTYDGRIKACPIDWQNGSVYTSLSQTSVGDAWHSEFYRRNRLEHLNNDFSPCSICKGCRDWQGTPWHLGYEKVARRLGSVKVED